MSQTFKFVVVVILLVASVVINAFTFFAMEKRVSNVESAVQVLQIKPIEPTASPSATVASPSPTKSFRTTVPTSNPTATENPNQ